MYQNNYYQSGRSGMMSQPTFNLKGRPVSSLEEVKATAIDFDGSVFFFPDLANKRIYTKQINLDGTASLNMYELRPIPVQNEIKNNEYITRQEFEAAMNQFKSMLASNTQNAQGQGEKGKTSEKEGFNF